MRNAIQTAEEPQVQSSSNEDTGFFAGDVAAGLNKIRRKLLNLSRRNKLLNFSHTSKSVLRFVDEVPDKIYSTLVLNEKSLTLLPVPLPKYTDYEKERWEEIKKAEKKVPVDEHAKHIGIDTSFSLPATPDTSKTGHDDNKIQTLFYPEDLDRVTRRIASAARTAIEETGVNMLYLVLGFLEWYESDTSEVVSYAPLLTVPVALEKGAIDKNTGFYKYSLAYNGEDITDNVCLREKLKVEWGLHLPEFDSETGTSEQYFIELTKLFKASKPRWKIHRQLSLSLLSFGKMLMYYDLDPKNWPKNASIEKHTILTDMFCGTAAANVDFASEYDIDEDRKLPEVPLILDADSSQHSAIIDAINEKNMVIEGPPGTGKSQTITNLIASFLKEGKSVLFVSEKLAALEVVRRRLNNAGLGLFCLELHSHKTQKKEFLDDVGNRLKAQRKVNAPKELDVHLAELQKKKGRLKKYLTALHTLYGKTDLSVHTLIWASERYRQKLGEHYRALSDFKLIGAPNWNSLEVKEFESALRDVISHYEEYYQANRQPSHHYWYGLSIDTTEIDAEAIFAKLQSLHQTAVTTAEKVSDFGHIIRPLELNDPVQELTATHPRLLALTAPTTVQTTEHQKCLALLASDAHCAQLSEFLRDAKEYQSAQQAMIGLVPTPARNEQFLVEGEKALPLVAFVEKSTDTLARINERLVTLKADIQKVQESLTFYKQLSGACKLGITFDFDAAVLLHAVVELAHKANPKWLIYRAPSLTSAYARQLFDELHGEHKQLHGDRQALEAQFNFIILPEVSELKALALLLDNPSWKRFFSGEWKRAAKKYKTLDKQAKRVNSTAARNLEKVIAHLERHNKYQHNDSYRQTFGALFKGLDTDIETTRQLLEWLEHCRKTFGPQSETCRLLQEFLFQTELEKFEYLSALLEQSSKHHSRINSFIETCKFGAAAESVTSNADEFLSQVADQISATLSSLNVFKQYDIPQECSVGQLKTALKALRNTRGLEGKWHAPNVMFEALGAYFQGIEHYPPELSGLLEFRNQAQTALPSALFVWLLASDTATKLDILKHTTLSCAQFSESYTDFLALAKTVGTYEEIKWLGTIANDTERMHKLICKLNELAVQENTLSLWIDIGLAKKRFTDMGGQPLLTLLENNQIASTHYLDALHYCYYNTLCRKAFAEDNSLTNFTGLGLENSRKEFVSLDRKILDLQTQQIASMLCRKEPPAGTSSGAPRNHTDLALLRRELEKKQRHIPIRQLVMRAGQALQALKPCFMMGPLSVAQYLKPGSIMFDVLIVDEASQLRPEDALGAIARVKQVIVVGDSNQLPPTSFFEKTEDDEDQDEESTMDGAESILDICKCLYHPIRRLRWHYRSQHEGLIAFSNYHFYSGDLVVFPSVHPQATGMGVKHVYVSDGLYQNHTNMPEAMRIIDFIGKHVQQSPSASLGVVTLNSQQRDLIEDLVDKVRKENPIIDGYLNAKEQSNEPFFVKNLENVQGDERDVIFISATYGKDPKGNMYQRFGPINGQHGWRRLNVLFTRAKKQVIIFSSMYAEDIHVGPGTSRGAKALHDYLRYARDGIVEHETYTARGPDSPFEHAVANFLSAHGYKATCQLGVAGYFLDLAVHHPTRQQEFMLAIECDGATYHSAKSARDRDRLRQENLERLGWQIHRIWSTDWFKKRENEESRLLKALEAALCISDEKHQEWQAKQEIIVPAFELTSPHPGGDGQAKLRLLSPEEAHTRLVNLRENVIKQEVENYDPETALLRPEMIDVLLRVRPTSQEDFVSTMPQDLRVRTDSKQFQKYQERVFDILQQI